MLRLRLEMHRGTPAGNKIKDYSFPPFLPFPPFSTVFNFVRHSLKKNRRHVFKIVNVCHRVTSRKMSYRDNSTRTRSISKHDRLKCRYRRVLCLLPYSGLFRSLNISRFYNSVNSRTSYSDKIYRKGNRQANIVS